MESTVSEDVKVALLDLCRMAEKEDDGVRKAQLRVWKEHDKFWHGVQQIFWSESRQEWLSMDDTVGLNWDSTSGMDESVFDHVINIYKAHGESIIAALSAQVPVVRFPPDNAEDEEDVIASVAYSKVADLVSRHNRAKLLQLQSLLFLWNDGFVAAYHRNTSSEKYGTVKIPKFKTEGSCSACGEQSSFDPTQLATQPKSPEVEGDPVLIPKDSEDTDRMEFAPVSCPRCAAEMVISHILDGETEHIKSRTEIKVFGGLQVKVPAYAADQSECGYLILYSEVSSGQIIEMYPALLDTDNVSLSASDDYERSVRTPSSFAGMGAVGANHNLVTLKRFWLRSCQFNELGLTQAAVIKKLRATYPDGCMVTIAGTLLLDVSSESLDSSWTIGKGGLSRFVHADAIGQPLIPIQKMTNTLANLTEETIEHGIPAMYADEEVLDFEVLRKQRNRPGTTTPVRRTPGESVGQAFYTADRATLSKEVALHQNYLEKMSQFVVGSFPSIYGGDAKSRTASEYAQSRQMALQRLSIAWTYFNYYWAALIEKSAKLFISGMMTDEKFTEQKEGNYLTVWIRRAELRGAVGDVEAEGADGFPISLGQKQTLLFKLLEMNSEQLNAAIFSTANRALLGVTLGFPEFKIPGQDQRAKQAIELQSLQKGEPVEPDMDIDDHELHQEVCKDFLVSLEGIEMKKSNPQAFGAILSHLMMHKQMGMMSAMQDMAMQDPGQPGQKDPQGEATQ